MAEVFFFLAATGAIAGAIATISLRNPFYSVLALVGHLVCLAALFLLLRAEFVAAAQVIVYAGAVMVLYVFVVSYVGGDRESLAIGGPVGPGQRLLAILFALVLFAELSIAILGSALQGIGGQGAPYEPGFGSPGEIGALLLTRFLVAFELSAFLLLIAAVGAVMLARRRAGLPGEQRSPLRATTRPVGTGTMAEAVAGLPPATEHRAATGATSENVPQGARRGETRDGGEGGW
jgi:NADH-quinone oxidoreductase subunit J